MEQLTPQAEGNPSSLDGHHREKQLMEARNEQDEEITSKVQSSEESMDNVLLTSDKNSIPMTYQDQATVDTTACLMEACQDEGGRDTLDNTSGHEESDKEPEDIVILSEGEENWEETDAERDKYPQETTSNINLNSENESFLEKEVDKKVCKDGRPDERDVKPSRDHPESENVESKSFTRPDVSSNKFDAESSETEKICESNQTVMGEAPIQPAAANLSADMTNDNEGHIDSSSLDYNHKSPEEMAEEVDGSKIATDIQQGQQLLQRLQIVQLRHDDVDDIPQEAAKVVSGREEVGFEDQRPSEEGATGKEEKEESNIDASKEEEAMTNQSGNAKSERFEAEHVTKGRTSSHTTPGEPEQPGHEQITSKEPSDPEDDQSDSDLLHIDAHEKSCVEIPAKTAGHTFSAAETSVENQNLQRAEGVFNLADNPDVLEIPFKTNISLESLLTKACTSQNSQWQFSEKKMKKDISQDIQKELVLVNQGRIPGAYHKGEVRQLNETKLLFEAFHQDNTGGPTRNRKPRMSLTAANVFPSVLERTRSLEMFCQKSFPVSRAHSLRVYDYGVSERDKSPENVRSRSPNGAYQDKTRLAPYPKQDKNLRLHRSMDSICNEASASSGDTKGRMREGTAGQESAMLKHNPFFKLRPALALQPEVEKDIREAREREEELRRQRCSLYGEHRQNSEDEEKSQSLETLISDVRQKSRGKLERVWPPPSTKDQKKPGNTQEPKVPVGGGQTASLWQRWESGLVNKSTSTEKK
ncbi:uncharacterized protein LOC133422449 isoform X2 [Cololabis saira]|uniref:uncharacterized protein LOC133422449 isoform X2 n=1 Tax=Cololabis saira TaxID=129043 RepID=UPI002AD37614|nr:uncharacterized protein LOC133422449 isoform X2 [Cololabis saira]